MYVVYILKSAKTNKYYIGHTNYITDRLRRHNKGLSKYTRKFIPWELIYFEEYDTKSEAYRKEMEIKSYKGDVKFKKLLKLI